MKITTKEIKQLIKEELENVMKEQEQLDEGVGIIAGLMATLFSPGVDKLEINNVELDRKQFQAVLQVVGEESPNALKTLKSDLEIFGVQDNDGDGIKDVDIRLLSPDQTNAIVSGVVKSKQPKTPKVGSKTMKGGNIKMQLAQMQTALDTQNPDNAMQMAKTILKHPQFNSLDKAQQEMVKKTAGLANLAR